MAKSEKNKDGILAAAGALGVILIALIVLSLSSLIFSGCKVSPCGDPIVHPTDEQIRNSTQGEQSKDPPYIPWWAE